MLPNVYNKGFHCGREARFTLSRSEVSLSEVSKIAGMPEQDLVRGITRLSIGKNAVFTQSRIGKQRGLPIKNQ